MICFMNLISQFIIYRMFVSTVKRLRVLKSSELSALSRKFIFKFPVFMKCFSYPLMSLIES